MMKIFICAVGKIKDEYYRDAIEEYLKRASRYADVKVIQLDEAPPAKSAEEQKRIEGEQILARLGDIPFIAMDSRGELVSSEELAATLKRYRDASTSVAFVIGGSYGLSDEVLAAAKGRMAFGRITFPHQLFRVVLAEQIFRALSINAGLPYHK